MATYTTFDDIYYYRDSIHYRDMLLYYCDSGKIWLSPSPIVNLLWCLFFYLKHFVLYVMMLL